RRDLLGGDGVQERLAVSGPRSQGIEGVAFFLGGQRRVDGQDQFGRFGIVIGRETLEGCPAEGGFVEQFVQDGDELLVARGEQRGQGLLPFRHSRLRFSQQFPQRRERLGIAKLH